MNDIELTSVDVDVKMVKQEPQLPEEVMNKFFSYFVI